MNGQPPSKMETCVSLPAAVRTALTTLTDSILVLVPLCFLSPACNSTSKRLSQQPAHRALASQHHQPAAAATQTLLRVAVLGCLSPTNPSIHPPTPYSSVSAHAPSCMTTHIKHSVQTTLLAPAADGLPPHTARQFVQTVINAEALQLFKLSASIGQPLPECWQPVSGGLVAALSKPFNCSSCAQAVRCWQQCGRP